MSAKRIVVVGGTAAGPKAAAKARRLDQDAKITIVQKEPYFSMSTCGYPYYVGGTFDNRNQLLGTPTGALRDAAFFRKAKDIRALASTEALSIDRQGKSLTCKNLETGEEFDLDYDKLVLATGSRPFVPPIQGINLEGVSTLQWMRDVDYLRKVRDEKVVRQAVIIGGGLIGIEACEAFQESGIDVTVVEMLPQVLPFLDWEMAKLVEKHIAAKGSTVLTERRVDEILGQDGKVCGVRLDDGTELPCGVVVVAAGVRPESGLAEAAGLAVGEFGGITVDAFMQTSDPDIYAAGDCIEVPNMLTGKPVFAPLGDLANLQGRVAAQNCVLGNKAQFPGTIQTAVCRVFDFAAGASGLSEARARAEGFDNIVTAITPVPDHPAFMSPKLTILKLVADADSGRLIGVQCVGPGDVSKRIAIAAPAIQGKMTVDDVVNLDLPYAPPFSPTFDPMLTAAHVLENKMLGRMRGISSVEVKQKVDAGDGAFFLDVRNPDEFEEMRLGIGETLIPVGALRDRLAELPEDKEREIICYCKISLRGYEAACHLVARGWTNVKVMEGGLMAWPYAIEK